MWVRRTNGKANKYELPAPHPFSIWCGPQRKEVKRMYGKFQCSIHSVLETRTFSLNYIIFICIYIIIFCVHTSILHRCLGSTIIQKYLQICIFISVYVFPGNGTQVYLALPVELHKLNVMCIYCMYVCMYGGNINQQPVLLEFQ